LPEADLPDLVGGESYEWAAIGDLDAFFKRIYRCAAQRTPQNSALHSTVQCSSAQHVLSWVRLHVWHAADDTFVAAAQRISGA
jgi:hypothetical protein